MNKNSDRDLCKAMSFILRHHPEAFNIHIDSHGWADINELISQMNKKGRKIDLETLDRIVRENDKKRFSYNKDKTKIRANQGHSIPVDLELIPVAPPDVLYHGTAEIFLDSIRKNGIMKMSRNHVHLSADTDTAFDVGGRHGKPAVLVIDAKKMYENGLCFYLSENKRWLCEYVPFEYVSAIIRKKGKELCTEKL